MAAQNVRAYTAPRGQGRAHWEDITSQVLRKRSKAKAGTSAVALAKYDNAFSQAVRDELYEIQKRFESLTNEFRPEHRPVYFAKMKEGKLVISGDVYANKGSRVLGWLNHGTANRYAIMNPAYKVRTKKMSLSVGGPNPYPINRPFGMSKVPRGGIQGRTFDQKIADLEQPLFEKRIKQVMELLVKAQREGK